VTHDPMTNKAMTNDRELDVWREQWGGVARPSPDFRRQVQKRIKAQDRRFWLGNLLVVAALVATVILTVYQLSHQANRLEMGRAIGVVVLLFVALTCRLWLMRGTWCGETRSIRAFVELWRRRVLARIRGLQIGVYIAIGWLVFCAMLAAANWAAIRPEVMAHPTAYLAMMLIIVLMLRVIWLGLMWLRRRKIKELNEVTRLLEEMETMND
jgi:hypothetical protein